MEMRWAGLGLLALLLAAAAPPSSGLPRRSVVLVVVDNARPSLGAYNVSEVLSPHIDGLASESVLFTRAFCQLAWCAPSRNSFLSGRRPDQTKAWGFLDHFREPGIGANWTAFPEHFKEQGFFTSSIGKVYHPLLPPLGDYPRSWSEFPYSPPKPACPGKTMFCSYPRSATWMDADSAATEYALGRAANWLKNHSQAHPQLFLAVGYQSPRLPWSYPADVAKRYPHPSNMSIAKHPGSPDSSEDFEWFRQNEVNSYSDIENITHAAPLAVAKQQAARVAYFSTITHVDDQVGLLLAGLDGMGILEDALVVLCADHGQNVGEHNMWSMMNVLETSLRVPLVIRHPQAAPAVYPYPVELVDLFPTVVALAGLAQPAAALPGTDLAPAVLNQSVPKDWAIGQITRCQNCTAAYASTGDQGGCAFDQTVDKQFTVPCCKTPRTGYNFMGYTLRTPQWRYVCWCSWDGRRLAAQWDNCTHAELYDHRGDTEAYNVDDFENTNLARSPNATTAALLAELRQQLRRHLLESAAP